MSNMLQMSPAAYLRSAPPLPFAAVQEAYSAVVAAQAAIDAAGNALKEIRERREALADRIAEHRAGQPPAAPGVGDDMVAALAVNPSAICDPDAISRGLDARREIEAARAVWAGTLSVMEAALSKVEGEIARHDDGLTDLRSEADRAAIRYNQAAYRHLASRALEELAKLHDELLAPLAAFGEDNKPGHDPLRLSSATEISFVATLDDGTARSIELTGGRMRFDYQGRLAANRAAREAFTASLAAAPDKSAKGGKTK